MNKTKLYLGILTVAALSAFGAYFWMNQSEPLSDLDKKMIEKRKLKAMRFEGAAKYYHMLKANSVTGEIDFDALLRARKFVTTIDASKAVNLQWQEMGPNNVGGRVRALLIDKDNNQLMYAGGVAGGLWKSTTGGQSWTQVTLAGNIAVSCIAQAPNGDIYVGTGEGLANASNTNYNSGSYGLGIYRKAAGSNDFAVLSATESWKLINRIAVDANGKVYAATSNGLKTSIDNGANWAQAKAGAFKDVKAVGNNVVAASSNIVYLTTDGNTWNPGGSLPTSNLNRIEVAIAPSNPSVVYAVMANSSGGFAGVYRTTDFGATWTQIGLGGTTSFNLFGPNNQGWYDNVAMVHKTNSDIVYVGGIDMWKGVKISDNTPFSWTRITMWNADQTSSIYVHADQHVYAQHPTNANIFYQGTDGGISKTSDGGNSFATINKNFNVTQFYSVAPYANGGAIAGTQDNGTQFLSLTGNDPKQAFKVRGGDGGWAAASTLNQKVIFASIYYGDVARSNDYGVTFQEPTNPSTNANEFYNANMNAGLSGVFVTPCLLWETTNFPNSIDSVDYVADQDYPANTAVDARSKKNNFYPFQFTLPSAVVKGDSLRVMDKVQSRFFIGTGAGIYMTKHALYFAVITPEWYLVSKNTSGGAIVNMKISSDGDALYYTTGSSLKRLTNLLQAQDTSTAHFGGANYLVSDTTIFSFTQIISSISIDPSDKNKVIVTLGGTGNQHIYYSNNAAGSNPTFTAKLGNLTQDLPVYASLIPLNNSNTVIIGTEHGMYATDNIAAVNPVWAQVNNGIDPMVPVYMLAQQTSSLPWRQTVTIDNGNPLVQTYPGVYNYGQVYAATHGRGIFTSINYLSTEPISQNKFVLKSSMNLFPNPANGFINVDFVLSQSETAIVNIYDIRGRLISSQNLGTKSAGQVSQRLEISDLKAGAYILQLKAGSQTATQKFIKN